MTGLTASARPGWGSHVCSAPWGPRVLGIVVAVTIIGAGADVGTPTRYASRTSGPPTRTRRIWTHRLNPLRLKPLGLIGFFQALVALPTEPTWDLGPAPPACCWWLIVYFEKPRRLATVTPAPGVESEVRLLTHSR